MAKPTYEELRQALQALTVDVFETYRALERGVPVISVGQWRRVKRAQELVGQIAEVESS